MFFFSTQQNWNHFKLSCSSDSTKCITQFIRERWQNTPEELLYFLMAQGGKRSQRVSEFLASDTCELTVTPECLLSGDNLCSFLSNMSPQPQCKKTKQKQWDPGDKFNTDVTYHTPASLTFWTFSLPLSGPMKRLGGKEVTCFRADNWCKDKALNKQLQSQSYSS